MSEREEPISEAERVNLSDIDVSPLITEMGTYNEQFSTGKMIGGMMRGAARGEMPDEDEHKHQKQVSLLATKQKYDPMLYRIGLNLESKEMTGVMLSSEGRFAPEEIRINISDREKFLQYLRELDPQTLTESQAQSLVAVFESLTDQLKKEYNVDNPEDDRMIELLAGLGEILDQAERIDAEGKLGISHATESLRTYYTALQSGHLREYSMVERAGLLKEVGEKSFGPSRWHIDSSPEGYERRWKEALGILQSIKKNPRAAEFFTKVKDHLETCAKYALDELATKIGQGEHSKHYRDLMRILNEYYDDIAAA